MLHPGDAISARRRVAYVVLLGALTALGPFTVDLYLPAFLALRQEFGATEAAIQLTLTGTMIGFGLGQLIVGPLSDKVGRRVPLLVATGLHILASAAAAFAPTLLLLGFSRVLMGMGAAAGSVVAMAIVRDLFGGKRLVVMLSRLALVSGVAPVAAPLIGSALLSVMPWRGIFVVLALYGVVMLVSSLFGLPETLPKERRGGAGTGTVWQRYRSVLTDRVFLGVLVIGGMTFSGLFSYLSASSFLFQETYGFTPLQYGVVFAANSVGIVLGSQVASRLAARFGPQWVLAFSTAAILLASLAIVATDALELGVWGTIVPLFFFMTACGFTFPCVQVLALDRHGNAAGTAASVLGMSNNTVAAVISPVVGLISRGAGITPTTMAVVMVGCSVVGIVALWTIVRPRQVGMLNP
ncbi:multidrug effflux MFS transporter [Microbacterium gorillae]|uniref:multidrug effflux MFS transporter n=1 Tax=Microbacterium gorillae TaxID=1231063 RepID=UPI00058C3B6B|nr:multidrug effflux MFS transporter [Microbacterium gorillae]